LNEKLPFRKGAVFLFTTPATREVVQGEFFLKKKKENSHVPAREVR